VTAFRHSAARSAASRQTAGVLIPQDLVRIKSAMLRARLTAHLLDEPRPDQAQLQEIFDQALLELIEGGFTVAEIATGTFLDEREVRRRLLTRRPTGSQRPSGGITSGTSGR
jgi:hypothetical protein